MRRGLWAVVSFCLSLPLAAPAAAGQPDDARVCDCEAATCATSAAAGWTNCGDAAPDGNDAIRALRGGVIEWDSTSSTFAWLRVGAGGVFRCAGAAAGRRITFTATDPDVLQVPAWVLVEPLGTLSCDGYDAAFVWDGPITGDDPQRDLLGAAFQAGQTSSAQDPKDDPVVTLRGLEKARTGVAVYSEGAHGGAADFVDCIRGATPPSPPAGENDTLVFTSGRSRAFWYRVTGTGVTEECGPTACEGSPCDYEITRNDAGASWRSMQPAPAAGGPIRHPTPTDTDADRVPDAGGTRPAAGDSFVVFRPLVVRGGDPATMRGARIILSSARADLRYLEFENLAAAGNDCFEIPDSGQSAVHFQMLEAAAPEGDVAFINIHDWAARQGAEMNRTDRTDDERPNRPITYRFWYVHDPAGAIEACAGASRTLGRGITVTVENGPTDTIHGLTVEDLHVARVHGTAFAWDAPRRAGPHAWSGNVLRGALIHDIPASATYPVDPDLAAAVVLSNGVNGLVEGLAVWDVGAANLGVRAVSIHPTARGVRDAPLNRITLRNAFIVNVDTNTPGTRTGAALSLHDSGDLPVETDRVIIEHSYISNVVGMAGAGGRWRGDLLRNANIDDDGVAPCDGGDRVALFFPSSVAGSVITRDHLLSCTTLGIDYDAASPDAPRGPAARTRYLVNNLIANMDTDRDDQPVAGLSIRAGSDSPQPAFDVRYNIIDLRDHGAGTASNGIVLRGDAPEPFRAEVFYNVIAGLAAPSGMAIRVEGEGVRLDHDYNRFLAAAGMSPVTGGLGPHEVDSDVEDAFVDRAGRLYRIPCSSPDRTLNPWGGPVGALRFGLRDLRGFHPAVTGVMDPGALALHDEAQPCAAAGDRL